jgi:hypothetical protein
VVWEDNVDKLIESADWALDNNESTYNLLVASEDKTGVFPIVNVAVEFNIISWVELS